MKNFIKSTLVCMVCFISSWLVGSFIWAFTAQLVIFIAMPPGITREILASLSLTIFVCLFLYITMYRNGYKSNISYEKKSIIKLLIPIIISVPLLQTISVITGLQGFSQSEYSYLVESARILLFIFATIMYALFMAFGFCMGYKKREKDRQKMMNTANQKQKIIQA